MLNYKRNLSYTNCQTAIQIYVRNFGRKCHNSSWLYLMKFWKTNDVLNVNIFAFQKILSCHWDNFHKCMISEQDLCWNKYCSSHFVQAFASEQNLPVWNSKLSPKIAVLFCISHPGRQTFLVAREYYCSDKSTDNKLCLICIMVSRER